MIKQTRKEIKILRLLCLIQTCGCFTVSRIDSVQIHDRDYRQQVPWALSASNNGAGVVIEGEVENFDRLDSLHSTVRELCRQIPVLLSQPLTLDQAQKAYTKDTRLTAGQDDIELASSMDELLALSNTFLLAVTASTRAGNILSSLVPSGDASRGNDTASRFVPRVESKVIITPSDLSKIVVEWESEFFSSANVESDVAAQLIGYSELEIDPATSKISKHRLLRVQWNGQEQDAQKIGQSLAALRRSVKSLQESPFAQIVGSSPVFGILDQVRSDLVQQLTSNPGQLTSHLAPLYIRTNSMLDAPSGLCAIEEFDYETRSPRLADSSTPVPIPGSSSWFAYATAVRSARSFVSSIIPALSKPRSSISASMFTSDARLYTLDGSLLLQGADQLVVFYKSLASWRQRTLTQWRLDRVEMLQWKDGVVVDVAYVATSNLKLPVSESMSLRGTDVFFLSTPKDANEFNKPKIKEIRQTKISFAGSSQTLQESSLFFRSIASAIQTGRVADDAYDGLWDDFLQRVADGGIGVESDVKSPNGALSVSDTAALRVYRLMENLLSECPLILDQSSSMPNPPGRDFFSDNISLQGFLGETLTRGRSSYEQIFLLSITPLLAAVRSGQLVLEDKPCAKVELNSKQNVQLTLTLFLKAPSLMSLPGLDTSRLAAERSIPIKVDLVSEYVINPVNGTIEQHRLVESRVNGQLTPGDIVSRWIRRQRGDIVSQEDSTETFMRGLKDIVQWVRSLTTGDKR